MKTIIANIPAIITKHNGKIFKTAARVETFTATENGMWIGKFGAMFPDDVIDVCKKATNWKEIRIAHFPMFGFHS